MSTSARTLWQVPEICEWNPYIADATAALAGEGWTALAPGVCVDAPGRNDGQPWHGPGPSVAHIHWPEKLAACLGGPQEAVNLICHLRTLGSRIVQTIHNVSAHEKTADPWFQHTIDTLTDGVHFFSSQHELIARANRPGLPAAQLHLPHPLYDSAPAAVIGCFGRIRDYKRFAQFAETLLADSSVRVRLLVAGHVDSQTEHQRLSALAARDNRLDYRPGFLAPHEFHQLLATVQWVALPYLGLHSSGVLVSALQAGRRVLSPSPVGGTGLYGSFAAQQWLAVDPWHDSIAITAWRHASQPHQLALPTWPQAAAELSDFYHQLISKPARDTQLATR